MCIIGRCVWWLIFSFLNNFKKHFSGKLKVCYVGAQTFMSICLCSFITWLHISYGLPHDFTKFGQIRYHIRCAKVQYRSMIAFGIGGSMGQGRLDSIPWVWAKFCTHWPCLILLEVELPMKISKCLWRLLFGMYVYVMIYHHSWRIEVIFCGPS